MKDDMLLEELRKFKKISASQNLREKIGLDVGNMSTRRGEFYLPLNTLRLAFATFILLLFTSFGYGLVASTQKSAPGSPLYPLKTAVGKLPLFGISAKISPKFAPISTPVPTISVRPTIPSSPASEEGKKGKEVKGVQSASDPTNSSSPATRHQSFWEWFFSIRSGVQRNSHTDSSKQQFHGHSSHSD